jgi:hypothetical protein
VGEGEGGISCTLTKVVEKFGHKNPIKHENEEPPRFSHNTSLKRI